MWGIAGDWCIFFTDVLLWSGVLQYVVHYTVAYIGSWDENDDVLVVLFIYFSTAMVAGAALLSCVFFYSGFYAVVQRKGRETWEVLNPEGVPFCLQDSDSDISHASRRQELSITKSYSEVMKEPLPLKPRILV